MDEIHRHLAGDLAGGGAAHAVGHHEEGAAGPDLVIAHVGLEAGMAGAEIRDEERVLVVIARAAEVGLAEDAHAHRT